MLRGAPGRRPMLGPHGFVRSRRDRTATIVLVAALTLLGGPLALTSAATPVTVTHPASCRPHLPCHGVFVPELRRPIPAGKSGPAGPPGFSPTGSGRDAVLATDNLVNSTFSPGVTVPPNGLGPTGIAYDPFTQTFWFADSFSNTVSVLSSSLSRVLATIPVGGFPDAIAFAPNVREMFVSNYNSNTVSVLNDTNYTTVATIPIGETRGTSASGPAGLAYDPITGGVFVASWGHYIIPCCVYNLSEINPATDLVERTIQAGAGTYDVKFDPATGLLYCAEYDAGTVAIVNGTSGAVTTVSGAGSESLGIAIDTTSHEFAVVGWSGGATSVRLYYESNNTSATAYTVPAGAPGLGGFTFDPSMDAFVFAWGGTVLAEVRPSDGSLIADVGTGSCLEAVLYVAAGPFLTAVDECSSRVLSFSASSGAPTGSTRLGAGARALAVDPTTGALYVADLTESSLGWIGGSSLVPAPEMFFPYAPSAVAFDPALGQLFVACTAYYGYGGGSVEVLSDLTNSVVASIPFPSVGYGTGVANGITFDPGTGEVDLLQMASQGFSFSSLNVTRIDPATDQVAGNFTVLNFVSGSNGDVSGRAAIVPIGNGSTLAIADPWDSLVVGVNATTGARVWTRSIGGDPNGLFVNPVDGRLDVVDPAVSHIIELNGATGAFVNNITTTDAPNGITYDPLNARLYVAENAQGSATGFVEALNATTFASLETVPVPTAAWAVAYLPGSGSVAVAGPSAGAVYFLGAELGAVSVSPPGTLVQGETFGLNATVHGGYGPIHWSWAGLPPGCASVAGPVLNCTPGVSGKFNVLVNATDRANETVIGPVTLTIAPYPLAASILLVPLSGPITTATTVELTSVLAAGEAAQIGRGLALNWSTNPTSATTVFNRTNGTDVSVVFGIVGNYTVTLAASFNNTHNVSHLALEVVVPPPPAAHSTPSSSPLSSLLSGPWLYILIAAAVLAAVVGALIARRRRPPAAAETEPVPTEEYAPAVEDAGPAADT